MMIIIIIIRIQIIIMIIIIRLAPVIFLLYGNCSSNTIHFQVYTCNFRLCGYSLPGVGGSPLGPGDLKVLLSNTIWQSGESLGGGLEEGLVNHHPGVRGG